MDSIGKQQLDMPSIVGVAPDNYTEGDPNMVILSIYMYIWNQKPISIHQ